MSLIGGKFEVTRCFFGILANTLAILQTKPIVILATSMSLIGRKFEFGAMARRKLKPPLFCFRQFGCKVALLRSFGSVLLYQVHEEK